MSKQDFINHYGKSKKGHERYNAAIRAECPGGDAVLDLLNLVSSMRSRCRDREEEDKLIAIQGKIEGIREDMFIFIRKKWGFHEGK
jgi:hypothetical protein